MHTKMYTVGTKQKSEKKDLVIFSVQLNGSA